MLLIFFMKEEKLDEQAVVSYFFLLDLIYILFINYFLGRRSLSYFQQKECWLFS